MLLSREPTPRRLIPAGPIPEGAATDAVTTAAEQPSDTAAETTDAELPTPGRGVLDRLFRRRSP